MLFTAVCNSISSLLYQSFLALFPSICLACIFPSFLHPFCIIFILLSTFCIIFILLSNKPNFLIYSLEYQNSYGIRLYLGEQIQSVTKLCLLCKIFCDLWWCNMWEIRTFILIGLVVWFFLWKKLSPFWQLWLEQIWMCQMNLGIGFFCKTSYLYKAELKFFVRMWRNCFNICEWEL